MNTLAKITFLLSGLLVLPGVLLSQVDRETIRHAEVQQQQLRMQVSEVAQQLELLIAEFERNGLGDGDEVRTLKALHGAVGSLSQSDMQRVVTLLQQSRGTSDVTQSRRHVADAYTSQKAIIAQLNQLMIEYRRQEAMYDLSVHFNELAIRQNANLKETIAIARETGGKSLENMSEAARLSLQVQAVEQESLHDAAAIALDELKRIIDASTGAQRDRMTAALRQSEQGRLRPSLRQAADDLAGGSLFRAASNQQTARDQLRELARTLARPRDRLRQLQDATQELAQLADEQQRVVENARRLEQRWNESDGIDAELAQADVVDRSEQIRRDLAEIAPELAQSIRAAQDPMQEARAALNSKKAGDASRQSADAARQLQQAAELVRKELARAQQSNTLPADAQAAAEQLLERVRQLRDRQEKLQAQTAAGGNADARTTQASHQTSLHRDTRDVEAMAASRTPSAAEPLQRAGRYMQQGVSALLAEAFVMEEAVGPQKSAVAALKEAESQLAQELQQVKQKKEQLAALEEARQDVGEMMVEQQKLNTDTAREAAREEPAAAEELARQQEALAERAAEAARQMDDSAKPAADALANAGEKMDQAGDQLADNKPQDAQSPQQQAMNNLQQAQQAMDQQIAQLHNELGTAPDHQQNLQNAADQLAEAQRTLTEAMQQLPTAGDLLEQQRAISEALQQMQPQGQTPPAESPLTQAQQAADRAAQQIAENQLADATQSMGEAQRALEQAARQPAGQPAQPQPPAGDPPVQQPQRDDPAGEQAAPPEPGDAAPQDDAPAQPPQAPEGADPAAQPAGPSPEQLQQLAERQAEIQKQAEAMAAQQAAAQAAAAQAAEQLAQIGQDITEVAANDAGALPQQAEEAIAQAADALAQAAADASANKPTPAEASAQQAQQALAQAQAAVAMAQSGITPGAPMADPSMPGLPMPGMPIPGQAAEMPNAEGDGLRASDAGSPFDGAAAHGAADGHAFIGLPERDRAAIQQSQGEPYPEEYAPQIEQYLRNLAAEERN